MPQKEIPANQDQPLSVENTFRLLLSKKKLPKAQELMFDLIAHMPFPHLQDTEEERKSVLAGWEAALALDALPSNGAKIKGIRKLLHRLSDEYCNEISWVGKGRYDSEVLNKIAVGMARAYHALPYDQQNRVWGFSPWEAHDHFAILRRTLSYNAQPKDVVTREGRLALQSLLLGLVEQHPTLLDKDFNNPFGDYKYVHPSTEVLEVVQWQYNHVAPETKDFVRATTVPGIPLSLGQTEDQLYELASAANRKSFERGFDGVLQMAAAEGKI